TAGQGAGPVVTGGGRGRGRPPPPAPPPTAPRWGARRAATHRTDGARRDTPRLRDGIDAALVVLRRPERRPVVVIAAPVPLTIPRGLQAGREAPCLGAVAIGSPMIGMRLGFDREVDEDAVEKEAEPRALPAACGSHA